MHVQELRRLIQTYSRLKKVAEQDLISFIVEGKGYIPRYRGGKTMALRSTLRSAKFFASAEARHHINEQGKNRLSALNNAALGTLAHGARAFEDRDVFSVVLGLSIVPSHLSGHSPLVSRTIKRYKELFLDNTIADGPELHHPILLHALHQLVGEAAPSAQRKRLDKILQRLRRECEAEVYKQVASARGASMHAFDVGRLAFAIEPALDSLPPGIIELALDVSAAAYQHGFNVSLAPYLSEPSDKQIRPLQFEVLTALVRGLRLACHRENRRLSCTDAFVELLGNATSELRASRVGAPGSPGGWPYYGDGKPQAWPTLAVLEFATESLHLLRLLVLLRLQEVYGFDLSLRVEATEFPLSRFRDAPFRLYTILKDHFCDRGENAFTSGILFGPPGTGKTSIIQAIAAELGWGCAVITPSDLAQDGPDRITARARDLLGALADVERTVVLLDEFDLFILSRGDATDAETSRTYSALVTNCMLPLLAAMGESTRARFFLATNYADRLDEAATRIGRFSAILPVWPPSAEQRREFFKRKNVAKASLENRVKVSQWATFGELGAICKQDAKQQELEWKRLRELRNQTADKWMKQLDLARPALADRTFL